MRDQGFVQMPLAVFILGLVVCVFVPACRATGANEQVSPAQQKRREATQTPGSTVRVGTFDSRALAMAYYRSEAFNRQLKELKTELEKARAAGDEKRVKELEAEGPALQELLRKQGFGTWPVDNILKKINKKIPKIAKQANVAVIVSKWDIVYQRSGVEFVDVTDLMVQPFDPSEKTRKIIKEIQKQNPVPLEELRDHQD